MAVSRNYTLIMILLYFLVGCMPCLINLHTNLVAHKVDDAFVDTRYYYCTLGLMVIISILFEYYFKICMYVCMF